MFSESLWAGVFWEITGTYLPQTASKKTWNSALQLHGKELWQELVSLEDNPNKPLTWNQSPSWLLDSTHWESEYKTQLIHTWLLTHRNYEIIMFYLYQ